jgi:hypothetical protein
MLNELKAKALELFNPSKLEYDTHADRISLLEEAKYTLAANREKIAANLRRYPMEIEIRDCYRVVLDSEDQLDLMQVKIDEEIARLDNPREKIWKHMNLLSGERS